MLTAEDPSSSCEGPSTGHPLNFSQKKRKRKNVFYKAAINHRNI